MPVRSRGETCPVLSRSAVGMEMGEKKQNNNKPTRTKNGITALGGEFLRLMLGHHCLLYLLWERSAAFIIGVSEVVGMQPFSTIVCTPDSPVCWCITGILGATKDARGIAFLRRNPPG